ncbi:5-formyltetrahydrofolate cyclo-ligase [uncultured Helicobacter sp.]|uniref:5-formyltetrahydrofolate cyclo-ligase n=1 Tax=uncultured Helicobacter sp. TaxID=175537 RepID=UPI00374EB920
MSIDVKNRAKSTFRSWSRQCLQAAHKKQCIGFDSASEHINTALLELMQRLGSRHILLYMPFGFETNSKKLLLRLRKQRKKIFIPYIMEGIRFKVLPFRLPLQKNEYGIFETSKSKFNLAKIDTAVIPVLGIDRDFKRIGFGKGMYDRFFSQYRKKTIPLIFVSRLACVSEQVLTQSHDIRGHYFISAVACCKRTRYGHSFKSDRVYNLWRYRGCGNLSDNQKDF